MPDDTRHSQALDAELITDPQQCAIREAHNGLLQFDAAMEMVEFFLQPDRPFRLRLSHILNLHRKALEGISSYAGNFRPADVEIGGSEHQPVGAFQVPEMVEQLCDYVNDSWTSSSAIHLASYVLWRLNWIHPFTDGNGRTSRMVSYVVLCLRLGYRLPGRTTIVDGISQDKRPYYCALEAADKAWKKGTIDLSQMEEFLSSLLAKQLFDVHQQAIRPL